MKTLRQIVELKKIDLVPDPELQAGQISNYANPKSDAERRLLEKHVDSIQKTLHPAFKNEAEQKPVFSGTVEKDKTHDNASAGHYQDGEDAEVYAAADAEVDFVSDNLTEDNLKAYDELLDNDPDAAVEFAMETVQEMAGDEDA